MWFNNLRIYTLTEAIRGDVHERLAEHPFVPCGSLDPMKYGFVPPVPNGTSYLHVANGCAIICAKRQEKLLPGSVVKELLDAKVTELGRPVGRKERDTLKDEIIFSLLPKAMTRSSLTYAYIDTTNGRIIVNSPNAKRAEDLLSKFREALGSLKCVPYSVASNPMTGWVRESQAPHQFEFGEEIELQSPKDGRVVRCKRQDLTASEVLNHIESGMYVSKLALVWKEAISFVVDGSMAIKSVRYADSVADKANDRNPESKAEQFDADFVVMTLELRNMLDALTSAFGGS